MWFDTHAHLYLLGQSEVLASDEAMARAVQEACQAGLSGILCVGIDLPTSKTCVELAKKFPGRVFAAVGIHPNSAHSVLPDHWGEIKALARLPEVVAIGETGLDWCRGDTPREVQLVWLEKHYELAAEVAKPLVVHCREAEADISRILKRWASGSSVKVIMHACGARWEIAQGWLEIDGVYLSFAGSVTYRNTKFRPLQETARRVPLDRLLVETDCPYLTPEPFRGKMPSVPAHVIETGRFLASLRNMSAEDLAAQTTANAHRVLKLPPGGGSVC